jgi:chemotaxis protein CheD
MGKKVVVDISDQKVALTPDTLITYALGSCVGVCLYDPVLHVGGLAHVFLPYSFGGVGRKDIYKFADLAVGELVRTMGSMKCPASRLVAKIAGGANMFDFKTNNIGETNVISVKEQLNRFRIRLIAEDTGENYGRTLEFNPSDGLMCVKTAGRGIKML